MTLAMKIISRFAAQPPIRNSISKRFQIALGVLVVTLWGLAVKAPAADKAAILLPGSINDQSWNAQGFQGVAALKALGWEVAYSENVQPADMAQALQDYARRGYTLLIGHTGRFQSPMQLLGQKFPKTTFIVGGGDKGFSKNVASVDFNNVQFGYLMGVLAAKMSKTGKIGSVNALEGLPNVVAQVGGYRKGAKSVRPDIQVKVIYIQNIEDAAGAKEAALSEIAWGADFLTGKLNAAQLGVIEAAKEKNVYVSGRSLEHTAIAPDNLLTNIVEKWGQMYGTAGTQSKDGTIGGKFERYGLDTKNCSGAELGYKEGQEFNSAVPPEVVAQLKDIEQKFATGALQVNVVSDDAKGGVQ
jgi:basic membrane protein A